ncbi:manganese and iron superoxide dismutase [Zopfia rhizophila CBS 207.26]|uniref:Manganese and iron superoxide dismutase n=1 Tax=Zopfia rhizophila CBS 207.26 TaxID=1314779 RepID=A0A6A6DFD8_9PEZI|nr:manganese and iron superoxide dismutase [Zopfia rhizophila CBS 207.26]
MIIRTLCRRRDFVLPLATAPAKRISPSSRRPIHHVPDLQNQRELVQNGIPGLFSPKGFKIAYTEYMEHIIDQLNETTAGTGLENKETKSLVIEWARNPVMAYGFNVASMAFNNHFFFRGINTDPNIRSQPSTKLTTAINHYFSSMSTLRESFLTTAESMFGPGFVWLVQTKEGHHQPLRILPTYIAGSPLSGAHYRRQPEDMNTQNAQSLNNAGKFGQYSLAAKNAPKEKKPLGGVDVVPLLCVNTWEHVWLHDYGVTGKRKYLEAWWEKINWDTVPASLDGFQSSGMSTSGQQTFYY